MNDVAATAFWPEWSAGVVRFISHNDFQRAVWLLFQESWRTRLCAKCGRYFIANKPAQGYCDTVCSNQVHQSSSLKHWREKGAEKRRKRNQAKRAGKRKKR